jgi:hypothetical protein
VRSQDSVTIICAVSANVSSNRSADIAWNFIKENWPTLYKRYSTGFILTRLVKVERKNLRGNSYEFLFNAIIKKKNFLEFDRNICHS